MTWSVILLFPILICFITVLYSCIHITTPYDEAVDDLEQERFLESLY